MAGRVAVLAHQMRVGFADAVAVQACAGGLKCFAEPRELDDAAGVSEADAHAGGPVAALAESAVATGVLLHVGVHVGGDAKLPAGCEDELKGVPVDQNV